MSRSISSLRRRRGGLGLRRLFLERLEDRSLLAAIITVNSTADSDIRDSSLTLREAILVNNRTLAVATLTAAEQTQVVGTPTNADADTINFNLPAADARHFFYQNDNVAGQVALANVATTTAATDGALVNPDPDWANSWFSILTASPLPSISEAVVINGYTQAGASQNTNDVSLGLNSILKIEINGGGADANGLTFNTGNSTAQGLVINRFGGNNGNGIGLNGTGNVTAGNYLGTDVSGTLDLGNQQGVRTFLGTNTIGGLTPAARNLISGNNNAGVSLSIGAGNLVLGNLIGTDRAGTRALGNSSGISGSASGNTIGGTAAGSRNVISGNLTGISLQVSNTIVQGNYIGTDVTGSAAVGNTTQGLFVFAGTNNLIGGTAAAARNVVSGNSQGIAVLQAPSTIVQGNYIGTNAAGTAAIGNTTVGIQVGNVSDNTQVIGNLISGNLSPGGGAPDGLWVGVGDSAATTGVLIQGNLVGTDATGTLDLGNERFGILLGGNARNVTIGGNTAAARNVVSGNDSVGISVGSSQPTIHMIRGNYIGTQINGTSALGNGSHGIEVTVGGTIIGGAGAGEANTIAFNGGDGVFVSSATATGNSILANSIFSNTGLGIDLFPDGPTPNDTNDPDAGANRLQNFPVITSVQLVDAPVFVGNVLTSIQRTLHIEGTLNSTASITHRIEFFASNAADPSGFGEGQRFLGAINITDNDNDGNFSFAFDRFDEFLVGDPPPPYDADDFYTSTATNNATNDTSEFSAVETAEVPCTTLVTSIADSGAGSLREAINCANSTPGLDTISFNISGPGVQTISPTSALPTITDAVIIDGYSQPGATQNTLANGDDAKILIELNGSSAGASAGLTVATTGSTIQGLAINRFLDGILIQAAASGTVVQGNFIGTDPGGTVDLGNSNAGVNIQGSINNTIGGSFSPARNVISGNQNGVVIVPFNNEGGSNNFVRGNFIGTNKNGTAALGNTDDGVTISGASGNTIGGLLPGERNVISANGEAGVRLISSATDNKVQGNIIGTDVTAAAPLGNGASGGVRVFATSTNNLIGAPGFPGGNTIAFNAGPGVVVSANSDNNAIIGNSIHSNTGLGIDLGENGVTPNDPLDADTGANRLQNFPVLTSVSQDATTTTFQGTLNSLPNTSFRIEFFANVAGDPSGFGEGQNIVGFLIVTTDVSGNVTFNFNELTQPGSVFTATATRFDFATGPIETSEFSAAVTIQPAGVPDLTATKSNNVGGATTVGSPWTWTVHLANEGSAAATFSSGQTIFSDNLPDSNITFGPVNVINSAGISGTGNISCSISAGSNLTCTAVGGSVILGASTANPNPFTLVATATGATQLFGITSDAQGRLYFGNNSNNTTGIPVKRFDPALFSGTPIALADFGPAVGDADGIAFGNGFIYTGDQNQGLRRTAVATGAGNILVAGAAINGTGSPLVVRPSDGHIFVGFGSTVPGVLGAKRIDEHDALGAFVQTFTTVAETETMAFDPQSGLIYYAPFGTEVRAFNPLTKVDTHIGDASGFIDGGLAFDSVSGLIFVGTANGPNSGLVETIDPSTGVTSPFASGFNGSLGILREPVSGDLYFLTSNQLFRLNSNQVFPGSFDIKFTATAIAPGTFANPRIGGSASIDPSNNVVESNESNNSASDSVTVTTPPCSLVVTTSSDVVSLLNSVNSLREAIICSNTTPGADTINVPAGTYTLTIPGLQEDAAATGDLDVTDDLTLSGATGDPDDVIIQAGTLGPADGGGPNGIDRVLHVLTETATASVSGVTIRHGFESSSNSIGGGILNEGESLVVSDSVVTANQADKGGGIYHSGGTLTINRSTISLNVASKGGGILNNLGQVVITASTISGNKGTQQGGGIINTGASMSLTRSTVSGNSAGTAGGGGIFNRVPLTATNSTISGNRADGSGGGIHNSGAGAVSLVNVTITNNTADFDNDEIGDGGGALDFNEVGIQASNTIIAGNVDNGGEAPDFFGIFDSQGFNLLGNTTGAVIVGTTAGNILGQNPLLGPLANNGGLTQTHALPAGSPAIDASSDSVLGPPLSLTTDQRGAGFQRLAGSHVDIGAFEVQATSPRIALVCEVATLNTPGEPGTATVRDDADNPGHNVLIVTGTARNDVLIIEPRPSNLTQVRVKSTGRLLGIFSNAAFQHIVAFGLAGNDTIVVNATIPQPTTLLGNGGIDYLYGGLGKDAVDGGDGNDHLFGGADDDVVCGGNGNDYVYGQNGNDIVGGDAGIDRVWGEAGNDLVLGADGNDFLYGGSGNDQVIGQAGNDQLFGDPGDDIVVGGAGNDKLYGSAGRDLLIGGAGTDQLFGETDDDILVAGSTVHDANLQALLAILAEWASSNSYTTRVANIRLGSGASGGFKLDGSTVIDDGLVDILRGDGAQDWFLFGVGDKLKDRAGNELMN